MNHVALKLPILAALRFGWMRTRAQWRALISLGALYFLLMLARDAALSGADGRPGHPVLGLIIEALQLWLWLVYVRWALSLCDGERLERILSRSLLNAFLPFVATLFLYGAIVSTGLVLLLVPGVLWGVRFAFAPLLVLDRQQSPFAALRESARLTQGVKLSLLGFTVLAMGLNLLGVLAFGVGVILTVPVTLVAQVHLMRLLQASLPAVEAQRPLHAPRVSAAAPSGA